MKKIALAISAITLSASFFLWAQAVPAFGLTAGSSTVLKAGDPCALIKERCHDSGKCIKNVMQTGKYEAPSSYSTTWTAQATPQEIKDCKATGRYN